VSTVSPLDNFPLVRTADCDAVRAALARVYAEPTLRLARGVVTLDARLNECPLDTVALAYRTYGGTLTLNFPATDCFVQLLPLRGCGEIVSRCDQVAMMAGQTCAAISPDAGYQATYSQDYAALALRIDPRALTKKLAAMTGASINEPLRLELQPIRSRHMLALCRYLPVLAKMLSDCVPPLPAWWISQTEQLLMVMFLCGHRHNYSHLCEQEAPDCAPWQVRRAENYIEANWQEGITLEALAEATGVSGFSLFRSFRKTRGYSPFQYVSRVRSKRIGPS
jgi:hypothetical protein